MSGKSALRAALSQASYASGTTLISVPPTLFESLSQEARVFFWLMLPDISPGGVQANEFLKEWNAETQQRFHEQDVDVQMEIFGFVSCITHEWTHHFDLLGTPFGANYHAKLCREYLAFQRWVPTLISSGAALFDFPLSDWLASEPAGPDAASRLMQSGPLGQALVDLRGPVMFNEVMRGAFPRRIRVGWGEHTEIPTVRLANGREYEKVNVNQLWSTIRSESTFSYVGPHEILEGRALVMNLLFLWHLLDYEDGELTRTLELLGTYIETYYSDAPRYLTTLEIICGAPVEELFADDDPVAVYRCLTSTQLASWYALHAPPPIVEDDTLQSLTVRFVFAARETSQHDWMSVRGGAIALLQAIDDTYSDIGTKSAHDLLKQSAQVLALTRGLNGECADPIMRDWFDKVLTAIQVTLTARAPAGYASDWGLTTAGNVLAAIDEALDAGVGQLYDAPARVSEWYKLRNLVLYKRGQRQEKVSALSAWFDQSILDMVSGGEL